MNSSIKLHISEFTSVPTVAKGLIHVVTKGVGINIIKQLNKYLSGIFG